MYFSVITMMTVGYGDIVPETTSGKVVAMATGATGIVLLAIPISIVRCGSGGGIAFAGVYPTTPVIMC